MLLLFFRQTEHLKDSAPEVQVVSFIHDADWWKGANEERKVNQEREERRRAGVFLRVRDAMIRPHAIVASRGRKSALL